jgi:phage shock protein PspC (stress-responsive transcriptional regulator)
MQKVITINLNGNAYQLDESGYDALHQYLADASRALESNPDRAEIVADLEQAIAEKCQRFLGPHKTVITAGEVEQIVREMGPIDAAAGGEAGGAEGGGKTRAEPRPKRLVRIPEGGMIGGVCTGLGAYLNIDVTLIRIGFVIVVLVTKGAGIVGYIIAMFLIPEAQTPEERAAAGGVPFNAREVVDRAARQYVEGTRQLRRQWRRQRRQWRHHVGPGGVATASGPPPWLGVLLPLFGLVHLALFLTLGTMLISLVNRGEILRWRLPDDVPVWAGVLILLVAYQIVVAPIRAAHHWPSHPPTEAQPGVSAFWNAVVGLMGLTLVVWIASGHLPEIREFLQRLPDVFRDLVHAIRDTTAR